MKMGTRKPGAGVTRWVIAWQSPPTAKLPSGDLDQTQWLNLSTSRCEVIPMPGDKAQQGEGQQKQTAWYQITVRRDITLLPSYRGTLSGSPYDGLVVYIDSITHGLTHSVAHCVIRGNT